MFHIVVSVSLWRELEKEELHRTLRQPPRNGFEELIQWTEDGKLWQMPMDNEFGQFHRALINALIFVAFELIHLSIGFISSEINVLWLIEE